MTAKKILIVDDEDDIREVARVSLEVWPETPILPKPSFS